MCCLGRKTEPDVNHVQARWPPADNQRRRMKPKTAKENRISGNCRWCRAFGCHLRETCCDLLDFLDCWEMHVEIDGGWDTPWGAGQGTLQVFNPFTEPVNGEGLGAFISLWTDVYTSNNKRAALHSMNTSDIPVNVIRLKAKTKDRRRGSKKKERIWGRLRSERREWAEGGGLAAIITVKEKKKW